MTCKIYLLLCAEVLPPQGAGLPVTWIFSGEGQLPQPAPGLTLLAVLVLCCFRQTNLHRSQHWHGSCCMTAAAFLVHSRCFNLSASKLNSCWRCWSVCMSPAPSCCFSCPERTGTVPLPGTAYFSGLLCSVCGFHAADQPLTLSPAPTCQRHLWPTAARPEAALHRWSTFPTSCSAGGVAQCHSWGREHF